MQHGGVSGFDSPDAPTGHVSHAATLGKFDAATVPNLHPHALVLDKIRYFEHVTAAANLLHRVARERHPRKPLIVVTTQMPLAAWSRIRRCGDRLEAILDPLFECDAHLEKRGRSFGTRHRTATDRSPASALALAAQAVKEV